MTSRIPTMVADVLIRGDGGAETVHEVGIITENGQQTFTGVEATAVQVTGRAAAEAVAWALFLQPGQIFFLRTDTGEWTVISPR